jgi:glycosyltransferase involved in cell wall biosynthesis
LLKSTALLEELRRRVDVLFVPMSFAAGDRANMEMGFPSKLTDYMAVGIPLLVVGPPYSSVVKWARDYADVAEVIDNNDVVNWDAAIRRLVTNPAHRFKLGRAALTVGHHLFSHAAAQTQFARALSRSPSA